MKGGETREDVLPGRRGCFIASVIGNGKGGGGEGGEG